MRKIAILVTSLLVSASAYAQQQDSTKVITKDNVEFTYTPIAEKGVNPPIIDTTAVAAKQESGWTRFWKRMGQNAKDKTFEKKIDFSFVGGPYYSNSTSFGIGLLAAGLYRIDKTDKTLPPCNISLFGSISVRGLYQIGVEGNNIFKGDKHRLNYLAYFMSMPKAFWGLGYNGGMGEYWVQNTSSPTAPTNVTSFSAKKYQITVKYLYKVYNHTFIGCNLDFNHSYAYGSDNQMTTMDRLLARSAADGHYDNVIDKNGDIAKKFTTTGIGLVFEYDSRDILTNAYKGYFLSIQMTVRPSFLGNLDKTLWNTKVQFDLYQRLWKDCTFAFDIYGEFCSKTTPWLYYSEMGGMYRMRGYYRGRFTDLNTIMTQIELRQKIWKRLGATAWVGAGNTFHHIESFDWGKTLPNYGVGLRWEFKRRMNIRLDYGFGERIQDKLTQSFIFSISEAF